MIDALLFAVRNAVMGQNFGYDVRTCQIMPDGQPTPQSGAFFLSIHQGRSSSVMDNALKEYFDFSCTLTMRVVGIPLDRIGDKMLAMNLARRAGPGGTKGFNARAEQLRAFLHMNWAILGEANTILINLNPDAEIVYGFAEPGRFRGMAIPELVGGDWLWSEPESEDVALKAELRFEDACRQQALESFV
jgi:hypothetical protein